MTTTAFLGDTPLQNTNMKTMPIPPNEELARIASALERIAVVCERAWPEPKRAAEMAEMQARMARIRAQIVAEKAVT